MCGRGTSQSPQCLRAVAHKVVELVDVDARPFVRDDLVQELPRAPLAWQRKAHPPSRGADVAGVRPVLAHMWQRRAEPPLLMSEGLSAVPVQMWRAGERSPVQMWHGASPGRWVGQMQVPALQNIGICYTLHVGRCMLHVPCRTSHVARRTLHVIRCKLHEPTQKAAQPRLNQGCFRSKERLPVANRSLPDPRVVHAVCGVVWRCMARTYPVPAFWGIAGPSEHHLFDRVHLHDPLPISGGHRHGGHRHGGHTEAEAEAGQHGLSH